jgi:uncharacterized membrane protein YdbT with pleckstrin-like domain
MSVPIDEHEELHGDDVMLAEALRADYLEACRTAPVPSAGLVWWRASLRARADAARNAERSLTVVHGAIGVTLAGAVCAAAGFVWRAVPLPQPSAGVMLSVAAAVCIVVVPLALVLAFAREP